MDQNEEIDVYDPQEMDEAVGILQLVCGQIEGKAFWSYVLMYPSKYIEYAVKLEAKEEVLLSDYGQIIKKGWGEEPPADIRKEMQEEYGADDTLQEKLDKMALDMIAEEAAKQENTSGH